MKRILIGATLLVAGIIGVAGASPVSAEDHEVPVEDLHCPDKDNVNKVETSNESFVPPLGAEVCVKGGTTNTGIVIADGV